jgi:hypothetical protein
MNIGFVLDDEPSSLVLPLPMLGADSLLGEYEPPPHPPPPLVLLLLPLLLLLLLLLLLDDDALLAGATGGQIGLGPLTIVCVAASSAEIHSPRDSSILAPAWTGNTHANSAGFPA